MTARQLLPALYLHLQSLSKRLGEIGEPVEARIAGGIAVNYYTGHRMSDDVEHRHCMGARLQKNVL